MAARGKGTTGLWLPSLLTDHGVTFRLLVETTAENEARRKRANFHRSTRRASGGPTGSTSRPKRPRSFGSSRVRSGTCGCCGRRGESRGCCGSNRGAFPCPGSPREPSQHNSSTLPTTKRPITNRKNLTKRTATKNGVVEMSGAQFDDLLRSMAQLPVGRKSRDALSGVERGLMRRVCGGYVALLDAALGRLLDQIEQDAATAPTMLIVTAARGMTVREPGLLLDDWEQLAEETVHTPLFVRPAGINRGIRRQELVQTVDLFPPSRNGLASTCPRRRSMARASCRSFAARTEEPRSLRIDRGRPKARRNPNERVLPRHPARRRRGRRRKGGRSAAALRQAGRHLGDQRHRRAVARRGRSVGRPARGAFRRRRAIGVTAGGIDPPARPAERSIDRPSVFASLRDPRHWGRGICRRGRPEAGRRRPASAACRGPVRTRACTRECRQRSQSAPCGRPSVPMAVTRLASAPRFTSL